MLTGSHETVEVMLTTDLGQDREGYTSIDRLLGRNIAGRWCSVHIRCSNPHLSIELRDEAYHEVTIGWDDVAAGESASDAYRVIRSWTRLRQFPSHFLVCILALMVAYVGIGYAQDLIRGPSTPLTEGGKAPHQSQDEWRESLVAELGEARASKIIDQARVQRSMQSDRSGAVPSRSAGDALVSLVAMLVVAYLAGAGITAIISGLNPWWSRIFPAFYFDLPSSKHYYLTSQAVWVATLVAGALLTNALRGVMG